MKIKIKHIVALAVMFAVLFLISYKVTEKKVQRKAANIEITQSMQSSSDNSTSEAPSSTEAQSESTEPSQSENAGENNGESENPVPVSANTLPEPEIINMPTDDTWSLVLINCRYKMNSTYEPLVEIAIADSGVYLDTRVAEKFREMYAAAAKDGVTLTPAAGYISIERQERKFEKQVEDYIAQGMDSATAEVKASFTVLPAGCSESNYGLAVDIGWLSDNFASSPAYEWLCKNAENYGFIERYTASKEEITNFNAQPWHWRYVGVEAAKEMKANGLCLEEYVNKEN